MSSRFDEKTNVHTNVVDASETSLAHMDPAKKDNAFVEVRSADDARLAELGYKGEFRREFSVRAVFLLLVRCAEVPVSTVDRNRCVRVLNHGCDRRRLIDPIFRARIRYASTLLCLSGPL